MSGLYLTERPQLAPSKCGRCGGQKYDGRTYTDFGLDIEYYGVVYLCSYCVREIFKFTFPDEGPPVTPLEAKVADLEQTVILQKELLRLKSEQISKMEEVYGVYGSSITSSGPDDLVVPAESERASSPISIEDRATKNQRTLKSSPGPRRSNLSSSAKLLGPQSVSDKTIA